MNTPPQQLHIPVLLADVLRLLNPQQGERYLDLTAGYGGHARQVISRIGGAQYATLCDRDDYAVSHLADLLEQGATIIHQDYHSAVQQRSCCRTGLRYDPVGLRRQFATAGPGWARFLVHA